jgi:hypothetical protein
MNESTFNESITNTLTSVLPDFTSYHDNYTKSVARGRNPKSIPRNSELWYHTKNSNERRDRIAKGHQFWGVVDNSSTTVGVEESVERSAYESSYSENNMQNSQSLPNLPKDIKEDTKAPKDDARMQNEAFGRKNQNNFKNLNSSRFDCKVSTATVLMTFLPLSLIPLLLLLLLLLLFSIPNVSVSHCL